MSKYDPATHHRRSIRLRDYDYSQPGAYFVTICTESRKCLFGSVSGDSMILNQLGRIINSCWMEIPNHVPNCELDSFIVMPNHVHGILMIIDRTTEYDGRGTACRAPGNITPDPSGTACRAPGNITPDPSGTACRAPTKTNMEQFGKPVAGSLATIIRSFKSAGTRLINKSQGTQGNSIWQRDYYEHIIRDEEELYEIRRYIEENPIQWAIDRNNPEFIIPDSKIKKPWEV